MQMLMLICVLRFVTLTSGAGEANIPPYRRFCPPACASCSAVNGCLSCKRRLFFHVEPNGLQQKGICLSSCPRGFYGNRSPHISTCTRCADECHSCFSERFCTRCNPSRFLFRGKCQKSCPKGLTANAALRECTAHTQGSVWSETGHTAPRERRRVTIPKSAMTAINVWKSSVTL